MTVTSLVLMVATLLVALVAGLVFTFAVIVMPGIARLDDRGFVMAFREMDGIIQRGDPLFALAWMGSVLALIAALVFVVLNGTGFSVVAVTVAAAAYILGVQLPTFRINIPLNNALQAIDVDAADDATWADARAKFETTWNRWNRNRTVVSIGVTALLLLALVNP